jgi:SAM-dependent methyltransferase
MQQLWNDRYAQQEFAFGKAPNEYLKHHLPNIPVGKIFFPAEGEGRNAVYAATLGWQVVAYDYSISGKAKALSLAQEHNVAINYLVGEYEQLNIEANQFDAIALIYAHFPADIKSYLHKEFDLLLKPGGAVIFEAFSKNHIPYVMANEKVGGPKNIDVLFSIEEIQADFSNYNIVELKEEVVTLNEGIYHDGIGSVIRFVGTKK